MKIIFYCLCVFYAVVSMADEALFLPNQTFIIHNICSGNTADCTADSVKYTLMNHGNGQSSTGLTKLADSKENNSSISGYTITDNGQTYFIPTFSAPKSNTTEEYSMFPDYQTKFSINNGKSVHVSGGKLSIELFNPTPEFRELMVFNDYGSADGCREVFYIDVDPPYLDGTSHGSACVYKNMTIKQAYQRFYQETRGDNSIYSALRTKLPFRKDTTDTFKEQGSIQIQYYWETPDKLRINLDAENVGISIILRKTDQGTEIIETLYAG